MITNEERIERFGLTCELNGKQYFGGHEFIDLGLPSGTLWAKCNLGAKEETDFGKYFQFGQFKTYEKTFENYEPMEVDTVEAIWYNGWKTPTKEQFQELFENTIGVWVTINGVNGYKFISKCHKTRYVFFPAAGFCYIGSVYNVGSYGIYWSSSLNTSRVILYFNSDGINMDSYNRICGFSVRGVVG